MSENTLHEIDGKINKVIEGLYGSLNEPGRGFINDTNMSLKDLSIKVDTLLEDKCNRKDNTKWTLRTAMAAIIAATTAIIKSFFFN